MTSPGKSNHKYLFITSYFPPMGGPGVQRQLYYVHYAYSFGWEPIILTVKDVVYHAYDNSLFSKIPQTVHIERTESLEFGRLLYYLRKIKSFCGNLFDERKYKEKHVENQKIPERQMNLGRFLREWVTIIDDRIFWIPFAYTRALLIEKQLGFDIIIARGGPHSNTILAYLVAKKLKKPLVLDLADPWLDYPYFNIPTQVHRLINMYWEEKVYRYAAKISVSCDEIKKSILRRYDGINPDNIVIVTNGYDQNDFQPSNKPDTVEKDTNILTITHVGSLGRIRLESFQVLCNALKKVVDGNSKLRKKFNFRFIGNYDDVARQTLEKSGLMECAEFIGYQSHEKAIAHLRASDILFLPISREMTNKEGIYLIPGKLFEYIGSNRPILFVGPKESDTARIISEEGLGRSFDIHEEDQLRDYLSAVIETPSLIQYDYHPYDVSKFERKAVVTIFYEMLNQVVESRK